MKKSIIFFAAIAAFFSCSKENPVNEIPTEETFSVELFATAPSGDADTKTTLVDGDGTKFVHWSKGDAIKVLFFPNTTSVNASFSGSNGIFTSHFDEETSSTAFFRCDSWSWGSKVEELGISKSLTEKGIAVYPAAATAKSTKPTGNRVICDTEVSFVLPETQTAVKGNIESNLNFSYATVELSKFQSTISNGAQTDLKFNNACAMIELTMPSTLNKKVTSISIVSNNDIPLTGKGTATMSYNKNEIDSDPYAGDSDHIFNAEISDGAGVTLNNANGFEPGAKYYVVVWPGKHDGGLTIEFAAEDGTKATKTTGGVELTASKVKPYTFNKGLVFESLEYDYYYSDGTIGIDPKPSGKSVIGVVFYKGNPRELDSAIPSSCTHGLAISVKKAQHVWNSSALSNTAFVDLGLTNKNGDIWGYTAKTMWQNDVKVYLTLYSRPSAIPELPMTGYVSATGWYYPTNCELKLIADNYNNVKDKLTACGGDAIPTASGSAMWTALAYDSGNAYGAYYQTLSGAFALTKLKATYNYYVHPIFAF